MFHAFVLAFPSSNLTTISQNVAHALNDIWIARSDFLEFAILQSKMAVLQITHMFLWLLSLSCCLEDMVQQPWAKHPDGRKCQPVTKYGTDLVCRTLVLVGLCGVNLDWGIDWPVNPQIKLTAAKWQSTADNTPKNWQTCCHCPKVKAN